MAAGADDRRQRHRPPKKARSYLNDSLRGLDSAEEEALATPKRRHYTRLKTIDILAQTRDLLYEARGVFGIPLDDDDLGISGELP